MRTVLVVGSGGREHALARGLARSAGVDRVLVTPGNAGIAAEFGVLALAVTDAAGIAAWAARERPTLVVLGPEAALLAGVGDAVRAVGVPVFGPDAAAAAIEGSKLFAKHVMAEAGVPTARWFEPRTPDEALAAVIALDGRVAIKVDGLAAGKGVVVTSTRVEAEAVLARATPGEPLVIEERLEGEELSLLAVTDGVHVCVLPPAQDHKRLRDGDEGPNTGGMGAYAPAPVATPELVASLTETCVRPVLAALARGGTPFVGVLYAGLMLTADGPRVLEYNARFGDPETEVIVPLLDEDLFALLLAAATGRLEERALRVFAGSCLGVVLASPGYPDRPELDLEIRGLDAPLGLDVEVLHAGTRRDPGGVFRTGGGRVLVVTSRAPTLAEARDRAYAAADRITWPGLQRRNDIGARALR